VAGPWLTVAFCRRHNIIVEAYSPLAKATKFGTAEVQAIAREVGATEAQVLLAYSLAKDYVTIPKSVTAQRQQENLEALDVHLTEQHIKALDALDEYLVVAWDPIKLHDV
jgi:diketogulonate reductase-like aldo/keto reductase